MQHSSESFNLANTVKVFTLGFLRFPYAERCKWAWPDDVTLQFKVDWR